MRTVVLLVSALVMCACATPATAQESSIPLKQSPKGGALLVSVEVNDKPRTFILDTGSRWSVVDIHALPAQLRLQAIQILGDVGVQGKSQAIYANLVFAGHRIDNQPVAALNLSTLKERYGLPIDGLLGLDVLSRFDQVTLDFKHSTLQLSSTLHVRFGEASSQSLLRLCHWRKLRHGGHDCHYRCSQYVRGEEAKMTEPRDGGPKRERSDKFSAAALLHGLSAAHP